MIPKERVELLQLRIIAKKFLRIAESIYSRYPKVDPEFENAVTELEDVLDNGIEYEAE